MNLYRKVRPTQFDDVIDNAQAVEALRAFAQSNERPHAYLFHGQSGTGKTTLARIFAKELGANEMNIREINSADNRGVDTAREIIQQIKYRPAGGGIIVYIIDEVHRTTRDWQEGMLKALEDTPQHVYFLLCTTEKEKLIKAMRTRLTDIAVKPATEKGLYRLLRKTAKQEGYEIEKEVIEELCEHANGSARQALVFLEQAAGLDTPEKQKAVVALSEGDDKKAIDLCRALMKGGNWNTIKTILSELKSEEEETVRRIVLGYFNSVLLKSDNQKAAYVIEVFSEPFYNSGKAGLSLACYTVSKGA